jgi:ferredoxin
MDQKTEPEHAVDQEKNSPPLFTIHIDSHPVEVTSGQSVLDAGRKLGIDIPTLCYLEKCGPLTSCLVCLVKLNGKLVPSCGTKVTPGMSVESETEEVHEARRTALELLFSDHVGDCLAPCNRLCPLGMNIPVMIRGIQTGQLETAVVTVRDALPLASVLGRLCHHPCEQGCRRGTWDDSASIREMERFVSDWDLRGRNPGLSSSDVPPATVPVPLMPPPVTSYLPTRRKSSGKTVVIIGAGPAGLSAAYFLLRNGHACTIADRGNAPGGMLRSLTDLPAGILDAEIGLLVKMGLEIKTGVALGRDLNLDGLLRGSDAVLLALGETSKAEGEAMGLAMAPGGIKTDPATFQTSRPGIFAAGRAARPMTHLVRAMSDGKMAADCIHQYLEAARIGKQSKPFSSMMGRLETQELKVFLRGASMNATVSPCDRCAGFSKPEATAEAMRCLHCDCRSSGNCALQTYAQVYGANASRFRQQRKPFEQQFQPGGVIFEPGKCILCGICVKLTEMAREPLGLTFVGRGFDVRIAAPLNESIQAGLQKVAEECVLHCPTGALEFEARRERTEAKP